MREVDTEELIAQIEAGVPFKTICDRAGFTSAALTRRVRKNTGKTPTQIRNEMGGAGQRISAQLADEIEDFFRVHRSTAREVAEGVGTSQDIVRSALRHRGLEPTPGKPGRRTLIGPEQWNEVRDRYMSGLSCREIGEDLGTSEKTVRKALTQMGVDRRPVGRPRSKR